MTTAAKDTAMSSTRNALEGTERQLDYLADAIGKIEERMIDPREFGRLEGDVKSLQAQVQGMQQQVSDMQRDVKALLGIANQGKGSFYGAMAVAGGAGATLMWVIDHFLRRSA